jgi:hypothetical protein
MFSYNSECARLFCVQCPFCDVSFNIHILLRLIALNVLSNFGRDIWSCERVSESTSVRKALRPGLAFNQWKLTQTLLPPPENALTST